MKDDVIIKKRKGTGQNERGEREREIRNSIFLSTRL